MDLKVSRKRKTDFYVKTVASLIHGATVDPSTDSKSMESITLVDEVTISGTGSAIAQAVAVATCCEAAGIASIAEIRSDYQQLTSGSQCALIYIRLVRQDRPADGIELSVVDLTGARVAKISCNRYWQLAALKSAVAGLVRLSVDEVDLVYGECSLNSARPLTCIGTAEVEVQLVRSEAPTFEGLWACKPCSILGLFPDGSAEYFWHDDYWDSPLRESLKDDILLQGFSPVYPSKAAQGKWTSCRGATGAWQICGHVLWQPFKENLNFQAQVQRDASKGLNDGVSEWVLVATFTKADGSPHEEKTFYMMPTPPGGYNPRTGEECKMWSSECMIDDSDDDEDEN